MSELGQQEPERIRRVVERIGQLIAKLEGLKEEAEAALLTFYGWPRSRTSGKQINAPERPAGFLCLPHRGRGDWCADVGVYSTATAVIALETEPKTEGMWLGYRDEVLDALPALRWDGDALPTYDAGLCGPAATALALAGRDLAATWNPTTGHLDLRDAWFVRIIDNILRNRGAASEPLTARAVVHPHTTYWATRALYSFADPIRAREPRIDEALIAAHRYARSQVQAALLRIEGTGVDVTALGCSAATEWLRPRGSNADLDAATVLEVRKPGRLIHLALDAQRPDGAWEHGHPIYVKSPREHVYALPFDAVSALLEAVPSFLEEARLEPEDILTERHLDVFERFVEWAERHRFRHDMSGRPRAPLAEGWASSAEPGAGAPECWATAIVLRTAKAVLGAVGSAKSHAGKRLLGAGVDIGAPPPAWRQLPVNQRIRAYFDDQFVRGRDRSALLAGPPGTGKTTLARSLAEKLEQPFICIAPNRLAAAGVDALHRQLERHFLWLSMLEDGLVLFDEIDELVSEREGVANDVFSRLLTTSMLPRFQDLHDGKKVRFLVATNHIENFDAAIRRQGRFDQIVAVERPDRQAAVEHLVTAAIEDAVGNEDSRRALFRCEDELSQRLVGPMVNDTGYGDELAGGMKRLGKASNHRKLLRRVFTESVQAIALSRQSLAPMLRVHWELK